MSTQLCTVIMNFPDPMIAAGQAMRARLYCNPHFDETSTSEGKAVTCRVLQSSLPQFVGFLQAKGII